MGQVYIYLYIHVHVHVRIRRQYMYIPPTPSLQFHYLHSVGFLKLDNSELKPVHISSTSSTNGSKDGLNHSDTAKSRSFSTFIQSARCELHYIVQVRMINQRSRRLNKAKQINSTRPREYVFQRKIGCLRWDLNPRHSAL